MQSASTQQSYSDSARYSGSQADFFRRQEGSSYVHRHRDRSRVDTLSTALGWFSVGLGAAEMIAPRRMARATGMNEHPSLMRALGAREIASGVGILSKKQTGAWLWARVLGDAMDLALLGAALSSASAEKRRRATVAAAAVAGVAMLDVVSGMQQRGNAGPTEINVDRSISVNRPAEECYRFWRNVENFPRFMQHVKDVRVRSETRSHWIVQGPAGTEIEWDADITYDQPNQLLVWHSIEGADVDHAGQVRFEQSVDGHGTVIHVEMQYRPPGGKAGSMIAKLFGESPEQQIAEDIRRFKQLIETGEIPTTVGQSSGPRSLVARMLRKGQPA